MWLQSLGNHPVLMIAFAGAFRLQALTQGQRQSHAEGAETNEFWRGLRNGVNLLGELMQQAKKLQTKESPPSSMAWLDGEGLQLSLDALQSICLSRKAQADLGTGLARPA